ncbi:MAG: glycoside hydrolase family 11 protein [Spirochaetales bacterium]|nr:glycoside hydrolase family 11 protein [Spirochaetales bacterium]
MKKVIYLGTGLLLFLAIPIWLKAQTICQNEVGTIGPFFYEYWSDGQGKACMILGTNGSFKMDWENTGNALVRQGERPGKGKEIINYNVDFQPKGNAWMGAYGWTKNPIIEYYIIDNWGPYKPPTSSGTITFVGTVKSDGDIYDIYKTRRFIQSISLPGYYDQFWSIRQTRRNSGAITVSNHFKAWENLGMEMGELHDVSFFVETYMSSGYADVQQLSITHEEQPFPTNIPSKPGDVNNDQKIDIVDALLVAQFYVGIEVSHFLEGNGDVNNDNNITIIDALLIAQCYVEYGSCDF